MKVILKASLEIGHHLSGLLAASTGSGQLLRMIRVARPNWPHERCRAAATSLRSTLSKTETDFRLVGDYIAYLDKQLTCYAERHAVVANMEVADQMSLARWENRWRQVRTRPRIPAEDTARGLPQTREAAA